jgi:tetratricopeptide (TPR) repeat protein
LDAKEAVRGHPSDGDPAAGRHIVLVVALLGGAAVVGYGAVQWHQRSQATSNMPPAQVPAEASVSIDELAQQVDSARRSLDVHALLELEHQLAAAVADTSIVPRALQAKLALAEALAARALEASIRGNAVATDREASARVVDDTITRARELLTELDKAGTDPARARAAHARIDLATGQDITENHPVVLLPTYRDSELRLATLARPLWQQSDDPPSLEVREDIVAELRDAEPATGLTHALLAIALHGQGDPEAALRELDTILARAPRQPLALGLKRAIQQPMVAAAGKGQELSPAAAPPDDEPLPEDKATRPDPDAPEVPGEERPRPAAVAPEELLPPESKPKPKPAVKPRPTVDATGDPKTLTTRGCKLVRTGKASEGFVLLQQAFDLDPGDTTVTLCMAEAHAELGRDASARAMCSRVLSKNPKNPRALALAAKLEDRRGDTSAAAAHYRTLLSIDPDHAAAKAYLAQ